MLNIRNQSPGPRPAVLLTTFDAASRTIAHQELRVELVVRQAEHLQVPLLGVPLHPGLAYEARIAEAVTSIPAIARFVFGDLHLEHIREWRTGAFGELAETCGASLLSRFPGYHRAPPPDTWDRDGRRGGDRAHLGHCTRGSRHLDPSRR